jgi:rsbT co-antagonist protein RsbR
VTIEELEAEIDRLRRRCQRERMARKEAELIAERATRELHDTVVRLVALTRSLSAPLLLVRRGVIVVPLIGILDLERAEQLSTDLLAGIRANRARAVVIDITGLSQVDEVSAGALVRCADAARLVGARVIVTGV